MSQLFSSKSSYITHYTEHLNILFKIIISLFIYCCIGVEKTFLAHAIRFELMKVCGNIIKKTREENYYEQNIHVAMPIH